MPNKIERYLKAFKKDNLPDVRPGDSIVIYRKIKEGDKQRLQAFEGLILARKHGKEMGATITVRKVIAGVGVEMTFPLHSPNLEKIEVTKRSKVRRAKLYYLRRASGERAKLKRKESAKPMPSAETSPPPEK